MRVFVTRGEKTPPLEDLRVVGVEWETLIGKMYINQKYTLMGGDQEGMEIFI